ncbi:hypothetical protein L3X38_034500 [Prunus dulcis]|uniref:Uncharacterized protein n=1 Tax=Prunus dulcis TaxID=3755 RepID=A0AAD4VK69_PRUDU|nr:hypothetical protein L3X38_034500 [Prunus dulcis]
MSHAQPMSRIQRESPSQIVPFPGCSPLQISNRFASLGATVARLIRKPESYLANFQSNGGINLNLSVLQIMFMLIPPVRNPQPEQKPSPASSHSSLPIEGKTKSELQEIARQLMLQAFQMHDDTDASPKFESSTSQPKPSNQQAPAPKMRWSDYPDEQDPYDFGPFNLGDD